MYDRKLQILIKLNDFSNTQVFSQDIPRGLMARIAGFHPAGPGSIPGVWELIFMLFFNVSSIELKSTINLLNEMDTFYTFF